MNEKIKGKNKDDESSSDKKDKKPKIKADSKEDAPKDDDKA